ncbi:hypothetical protein ACLKA7_007223 [Drosophila subpalustris]
MRQPQLLPQSHELLFLSSCSSAAVTSFGSASSGRSCASLASHFRLLLFLAKHEYGLVNAQILVYNFMANKLQLIIGNGSNQRRMRIQLIGATIIWEQLTASKKTTKPISNEPLGKIDWPGGTAWRLVKRPAYKPVLAVNRQAKQQFATMSVNCR